MRSSLCCLALAVLLGAGCPSEPATETETVLETETEPATETETETDLEIPDPGGTVSFTSTVGGDPACDTEVALDFVGPYTGHCLGCDLAFYVEGEVVSSDPTADCADVAPAEWTWVADPALMDRLAHYPDPERVIAMRQMVATAESVTVWSAFQANVVSYTDALLWGFEMEYEGTAYTYHLDYWHAVAHADSDRGAAHLDLPRRTVDWTHAFDDDTTDRRPFELSCAARPVQSDAGTSWGGSTLEGTLPCAAESLSSPTVVDVYTFEGEDGQTARITVDTPEEATGFDPLFWVNGPDGCTLLEADDNFDCSEGAPFSQACPAGQLETTEGTYQIVVASYGYCADHDGDQLATYQLRLEGLPGAGLSLAHDDVSRGEPSEVWAVDLQGTVTFPAEE